MTRYKYKSRIPLNVNEQQVLSAALANAMRYGELNSRSDGVVEFPFCLEELDTILSLNQLKGYMSALQKKGYVTMYNGECLCYFSGAILTVLTTDNEYDFEFID